MNARWIRLGPLAQAAFEDACVRIAGAQRRDAVPVLAWAQEDTRYLFALVAPRLRAPGRASRWMAWGLAPAVATYRQFGLAAYLEGEGICLHGERIAAASVREVRECVLITSSFLARFPGSPGPIPSSTLEDAFRGRLEAQHGWQFDHSWPTAPERVDYALA